MKNFKNKKVAVVGFGVEGAANVDFFVKKGARVWVLDERKKEDLEQNLLAALEEKKVEYILGEEYIKDLSQFDVVVRSPGVKLSTLQQAIGDKQQEDKITSQTKLFFDLCPAKIIGVTGTKGKGTTSTLIYEMLKAAGRDVFLGGNIGRPPFTFLDKLTPDSWVVLELSSFQLQDLQKSPHIAVMLMIVPEHLNYHEDMGEYVDAKRNILRFQTSRDFAVVNRDYIATNESDIYTDGQVFYITRERSTTEQGAFVKESAIWMRMMAPGQTDLAQEWKIIDTDKIALPGKHNWENAAAAAMAATLAGCAKADIVHVLQTFRGLEHRLQLVREINGVKYYDDSFSTTPETAIAAIEAFDAPEILILGGSSKHSDFTALGEIIAKKENIKAIIGIGEEWERMKAQFPISNVQFPIVEGAKDMKTIVLAASKIAQPGDVVLLSPACASFDMFKNYKDRGEQFNKEVSLL